MNDPQHELALAAYLLGSGQLPLAAEAAARGLETDPDLGQLWLIRGEVEFRRANFDLARAAFEHAGSLVPLDGRRLCQLAECYGRTGESARAADLLSLLADDPHCATDVLPLVAAGFGQLGENQRAFDVCRLAAERDRGDAAPYFGAAYYLRRLGYPAAAVLPWASRAFELEPGGPLYRTALALLMAEAGRQEEAYDLLAEAPINGCGCPARLRRMMSVFQAAGDHARWQECSEQLRRLRSQ